MDISPAEVSPVYNSIGQTYTRSRRADPRIVDELVRLLALPESSMAADIGAGTGNYTRALADRGFRMVAVEPSPVMRAQATPHPRVAWREGVAERIPIADNGVGGVVSTLAVHHFADLSQAFREMARIVGSGSIVLFTFDTATVETLSLWMRDYWPTFFADARRTFPPLSEVASLAEASTGRTAEIVPFPLPPDLVDLMLASGWCRPETYLDPEVRAGISSFALGDPETIDEGVKRLRRDLESGIWEEKYGTIRQEEIFDAGYRFLVLRPDKGDSEVASWFQCEEPLRVKFRFDATPFVNAIALLSALATEYDVPITDLETCSLSVSDGTTTVSRKVYGAHYLAREHPEVREFLQLRQRLETTVVTHLPKRFAAPGFRQLS